MQFSKQFVSSFPVLGRFDKFLGRFLTFRGKAIALATAFFLVGSFHIDSPVYYLCGACLTMLIFSYVASVILAPRLNCQIVVPQTIEQGVPFETVVEAVNAGHWPALDLDLSFARSSKVEIDTVGTSKILEIAPGGDVVTRIHAQVANRGVFDCADIAVKSTYPFHLFHRTERTSTAQQLVVVPPLKPLKSSAILSRSISRASSVLGPRFAKPENQPAGSREYVPGIDVRRWDYVAWARIGTPHVRLFESESTERSSLIVDSRGSTENTFESMLVLARALLHEMDNGPAVLENFVVGHRTMPLQQDGHHDQQHAVLHKMAELQPGEDQPNIDSLSRPQFVVLVVAARSAAQLELLQQLQAKGHQVFAILVQSDASSAIDPSRPSESGLSFEEFQTVSTSEINEGCVRI